MKKGFSHKLFKKITLSSFEMNKLIIEERNDLFAIANKYIIKYIGINLRPVSYSIDKNTGIATVKLNCIFPIESINHPIIFENVGILKINTEKKVIYSDSEFKINKNILSHLKKNLRYI